MKAKYLMQLLTEQGKRWLVCSFEFPREHTAISGIRRMDLCTKMCDLSFLNVLSHEESRMLCQTTPTKSRDEFPHELLTSPAKSPPLLRCCFSLMLAQPC